MYIIMECRRVLYLDHVDEEYAAEGRLDAELKLIKTALVRVRGKITFLYV